LTGLEHISGVKAPTLPDGEMRDMHRMLVGEADRLGNIRQIKALLDRGYQGIVSFEPFAAEIMNAKNSETILKTSMDFRCARI